MILPERSRRLPCRGRKTLSALGLDVPLHHGNWRGYQRATTRSDTVIHTPGKRSHTPPNFKTASWDYLVLNESCFLQRSLEVSSMMPPTPVAGVGQQGFGHSPRRLAEVRQHFPSVARGPNPSHSSLACSTWNTHSLHL